MTTTRLVPLFDAPFPPAINVSYHFPSDNVIQMHPQDFAWQHGMIAWTETVLIDKNQLVMITDISKKISCPIISEQGLKEVLHRTRVNSDNLVISYMNDSIGWGVFTREFIAKDDYVSLYGAVFKPSDGREGAKGGTDYAIRMENAEGRQVAVEDAKDYGNVSRFFQHAPMPSKFAPYLLATDITIADYEFKSKEIKESVIKANLIFHSFKYQGIPIFIFSALEDIQKNTWLTFDYGEYWLSENKHPYLIHKDGTLVDSTEYSIKKWVVKGISDDMVWKGVIEKNKIASLFSTGFTLSSSNAPDRGGWDISGEEFKQAFEKTPKTSPYIFLDKLIKSEVLSSQQGLFSEYAKQICAELSNITSAFGKLNWHYTQKSDIAYLHHDDAKVIQEIKNYLDNCRFKTQAGHDKKTKQPLLYVHKPKLSELRKIVPLPSESLRSIFSP